MKKILFTIPLMAISLLASCGGSKSTTFTLTFNCDNCIAYDENNNEVKSVSVQISDPTHTTYQKFHFEGVGSFKVPLKSNISIKKTGSEETVDFEYINGAISIPIISNLTINASGSFVKRLEDSSWDEISQVSKTGRPDDFFNVGDTKSVMVNGVSHKVRIIGFNQDVDKDGNDIGITFEFANLISDNQSFSLGTQWNDTNDIDQTTGTANHNYLDSSIRRALTNEGNGHILWAQDGQTTWTTDTRYKDKSVLDMLPKDLKDVLVAPKKMVPCYKNGEWSDTLIVNNKGECDTLFLLSLEEFGLSEIKENAYSYYLDGNSIMKEQVSTEEGHDRRTSIPYVKGSGQMYEDSVVNTAGYDGGVNYGAPYWIRAPYTANNYCAYYIEGGLLYSATYRPALAIAPAFCI